MRHTSRHDFLSHPDQRGLRADWRGARTLFGQPAERPSPAWCGRQPRARTRSPGTQPGRCRLILVSGFDAVIHLAGESIVGRWTAAKKRRILESRAQGTGHLAEAAAQASPPPRVFISASAVGFYGNRGDEILREDSPSGEGFAAEICRQWEAATQPAAKAGIRTAQMRFGVVMSADGGALPKMLTPFRLGLGGRLGNGRQWWPWVSVRDVVGAIQHVLHHESLSGPVNTVAPNPVTNAEFTRILASVLKRPALFPMPAFAVRIIFGEMGEELFLGSQRVEPARLAASGYQFQHPDLKNALQEILQR